MSVRKKIIISAGSNWANTMVTAIIGLVLVPVVLAAIGEKAYGIWALFAYGLAYPMILDSSFTLAINRFVAYYRNDTEQLNRFTSASFLTLSVLAMLTFGVSVLLSFFVADIFSAVTDDMAVQAKVTCILVGATFALKMLESTFSGVLQGFLYYSRYNLVIILGNILRGIFVIVFLLFRRDAVTVQSGYMVSAAISAVLMYIVAHRSIPELKLQFSLVTKKTLYDLSKHTIHSIARSGSLILMFNTLTLLVGWGGSATDVMVYTIACRLPGFFRGLLAGAQNVFLPAVTGLYAEGKIDKVRRIITKGTHISAVITCAGCILLFLFAEELLVFWLRRPVPVEMVLVMRILIISVIPRGLFGIWLPALVGMEYLRWLSIMALTIAAGGISITIIMISKDFSTPAMAPALGQLIMLCICWGLWLPVYGVIKSGMDIFEYLRDSMLGVLLAAAVSTASIWLLKSLFLPTNIHWLAFFILSAIIILTVFSIITLRSEIIEFSDAIKKKFRRKKATLV